ncbi:MAG TPA: hypothetical protein PLV92_19395, partial [Pirellulaceae bacterium]|nr:hypothetical protein [Pirellulaceae bacterium]
TVSFTNLGTLTTPSLSVPPVTVTALTGGVAATVNVLNLNGLGVVGGAFSSALDGVESLRFTFTNAPAVGVHYFVASGGNLNGNGTVADGTIEAWDGNGVSLGVLAINNTGDKDLSLLFGGVPLSAFQVNANVDNQIISQLSYNAAVTPKPISFTNLGTFTTASLSTNGVTVTADDGANPATVNVLNLNGLGVVGGAFSNTVDGSEALLFDFGGTLMDQVVWFVSSAGNLNGNGTVGDATVEAWDRFGNSLGVVAINGSGNHDLRSVFGPIEFTKFRVRANVDNHVVASLSVTRSNAQVTDFRTLSTTTTDRFASGGIVAHAQSGAALGTLGITNGVGLGVVGGSSSSLVEGAESVVVFCDGAAAGDFEFDVAGAVDVSGNAIAGEATVQAFDGNGNTIGTVPISGNGNKVISAMLPALLYSGLKVTANVDALTITRIKVLKQPGQFAYPFYGTGCPGTGGLTPSARNTAFSPHGGSATTLRITNGLPGSTTLLFLGTSRANLAAGYGCRLFVSPVFGPYGPFPLDGTGAFSVSTTLPALVAPVTLTVQSFVIDGGVPAGFSNSNGIELNLLP